MVVILRLNKPNEVEHLYLQAFHIQQFLPPYYIRIAIETDCELQWNSVSKTESQIF